jgi:alkaline phosphatase D
LHHSHAKIKGPIKKRYTMRHILTTGLLLACALSLNAADKDPALQVLAFGSCNKQDKPQTYWQHILSQQPDLWIWLGDNIYADTADMQVMQAKYQQQMHNPDYQRFTSQVPVTGIWDDHDYGMNDGNRMYPQKTAAKQQFMRFMGLNDDLEVAHRPGIYRSELYGQPPQQVKLILLDTRSFQDPLARTPWGGDRNYLSHPNGTLLGAEQWQWLEQELNNSKAQINLIASSLQVIAEDHRYEMWANFPNERSRLLDLLVDSGAKNPIILSGDRHLSEISQQEWRGQRLTDITSSGLTHSFSGNWEDNRHRTGSLVTDESYGLLSIDWSAGELHIQLIKTNGEEASQLTMQMEQ